MCGLIDTDHCHDPCTWITWTCLFKISSIRSKKRCTRTKLDFDRWQISTRQYKQQNTKNRCLLSTTHVGTTTWISKHSESTVNIHVNHWTLEWFQTCGQQWCFQFYISWATLRNTVFLLRKKICQGSTTEWVNASHKDVIFVEKNITDSEQSIFLSWWVR